MRYIYGLFLSTLVFFSISFHVVAAEFVNDYKAEYFLSVSPDNKIKAHVKFTLTMTNTRSDVYVKKVTLGFPKTFTITNFKATDGNATFNPEITSDDVKTNILIDFHDPAIGKDSQNIAQLEFDQENLFTVNGNVWEVILPTVEDPAKKEYKIIVHLPNDTSKKISVSKPVPDEIRGNTITWNDPKTRTIYAVFGDTQYYKMSLNYHLQNPKIIPVYTEIAFPPDMTYQKVYVDSIEPKPSLTYTDEDGNFIGRYTLKPKEQLDITFNGTVGLFTRPRPDTLSVSRDLLNSQKHYLLTQKSYWQLGSLAGLEKLKTPQDVYRHLVDTFKYNYSRVNKDMKRLGAQQALLNPDQAVCVEFSDAFVGIAREKGIYSREIQGYGFSNDPQLRPLSLAADILHSWPEYFDAAANTWTPVDPTWENTSGIDYLSSFDLNHIAFAIHGKRPDYPLPAGSYKIKDSRDITVQAAMSVPAEKTNIQLLPPQLPDKIGDRTQYQYKLTVKNNGNSYAYDIPVKIIATNLILNTGGLTIKSLAPYEEKKIALEIQSETKNKKIDSKVQISLMDEVVYQGTVIIVPYYFELGLKVGYIVLGASTLILSAFFLLRLHKQHKNL